jgi:RNA polymerase sigma-70 factor (ECF subfamily)
MAETSDSAPPAEKTPGSRSAGPLCDLALDVHRPRSFGLPTSAEVQDFLTQARPKLKRLLQSCRVPPEDAEDLIQDTLLILICRWEQTADMASREAWLFGTLRNTILQYWRRRTRERRLLEALALELSLSHAPPQERQDSARDVESITAGLPRRDRQILWLRYALELGPQEAAQALGCHPESVRQLSRRALERVRRQVAGAAAG